MFFAIWKKEMLDEAKKSRLQRKQTRNRRREIFFKLKNEGQLWKYYVPIKHRKQKKAGEDETGRKRVAVAKIKTWTVNK